MGALNDDFQEEVSIFWTILFQKSVNITKERVLSTVCVLMWSQSFALNELH